MREAREGRRKDKLLTGEIRQLNNQQQREGRVRPRRGEAGLKTFQGGNYGEDREGQEGFLTKRLYHTSVIRIIVVESRERKRERVVCL